MIEQAVPAGLRSVRYRSSSALGLQKYSLRFHTALTHVYMLSRLKTLRALKLRCANIPYLRLPVILYHLQGEPFC